MLSLGTTLGELEAVCAGRDEGAEARVYELASAFTDMAGFFDTGPLYAAAFSLCESSDRMIAGEVALARGRQWGWVPALAGKCASAPGGLRQPAAARAPEPLRIASIWLSTSAMAAMPSTRLTRPLPS